MKKFYAAFRFALLCAMTVVFASCEKEKVEIINPKWNYTTFTDVRDGKIYKSIKIGSQVWMAENLAYSISDSWTFYNDEKYGALYGRLYTWDAAQRAVPSGWHLPTDAEWKQLEIFLGMSPINADGFESRGTDEGSKLKSSAGWADNRNGTDEVGFAALPGGYRSNFGSFVSSEWYGYWWSANENNTTTAWFRYLGGGSAICRNYSFKGEGHSVRCIKNE